MDIVMAAEMITGMDMHMRHQQYHHQQNVQHISTMIMDMHMEVVTIMDMHMEAEAHVVDMVDMMITDIHTVLCLHQWLCHHHLPL